MPQLIPFYFTNQTVSIFILLAIVIFIHSKYNLPRIPRLYATRDLLYTF